MSLDVGVAVQMSIDTDIYGYRIKGPPTQISVDIGQPEQISKDRGQLI